MDGQQCDLQCRVSVVIHKRVHALVVDELRDRRQECLGGQQLLVELRLGVSSVEVVDNVVVEYFTKYFHTDLIK